MKQRIWDIFQLQYYLMEKEYNLRNSRSKRKLEITYLLQIKMQRTIFENYALRVSVTLDTGISAVLLLPMQPRMANQLGGRPQADYLYSLAG